AGSGWKEKFRKLPYGKGVGLACSSYLTGAGLPIYWNAMPHSGVQLKCDRGGGVTVFCGSTEIGQGSDSILAMLVAEVLGVEPGDVAVVTGDTDLTPVDLGSYSSRVTLMTGNAALPAAGGAGGAARVRGRPRVRRPRPRPRARVRRRGAARRGGRGDGGDGRLLHPAGRARPLPRGRRRPLSGLLLQRLRRPGGRGSRDGRGAGGTDLDRP